MTRLSAPPRSGEPAAWSCVLVMGVLHAWAIWVGLGGRAGLASGWPIWRDDHPLYYHTALVTRRFLRSTWTTAGYDPSFMAGYAKSVIFPSSSTLPELVVAAFGGAHPEFAYKVYVLVSAAAIPWLVAAAGVCWRAPPWAVAVAVALFLTYIWTDFPINYAAYGMLPYLLAIPWSLAATGAFCRYLERGGPGWWSATAVLMVGVVLVHLTGAMIVVPASALAYAVAARGGDPAAGPFRRRRHLGVWCIPVLVLAGNAFWWLPGLWLASTKGPSDFAFAHSEGVYKRLRQVVTLEAPIQSVLLAGGLLGLAALARRDRVGAAGLAGFVAAGAFWGYLAGAVRALDFLQPGRHTYAFYTALSLAAGIGVLEVLRRLAQGPGRLDRWAVVGMILIAARVFGPSLEESVRLRDSGPRPFLTSRPTPRLSWLVDRLTHHFTPGQRLLYEEGGFSMPGIADPYEGGRFSGLLPERTGLELIGGPYLHASLRSNFTQFGEGKLFGEPLWGRDHFERYARLYRPSAIVCFTPWARGFCRSQRDLIEILEDDGAILIGRVAGFGGPTIAGKATVGATPGRLVVRDAAPGVDGTIVLRYHSVPCLRTSPPVAWDSVFLEKDPVPFIRLRTAGTASFEIHVPPRSSRGPKR